MEETGEIVIGPNYLGLILAVFFWSAGVFVSILILPVLLELVVSGSVLSEILISGSLILILASLLFGSLWAVLSNLYVLLTGLHSSVSIRITGQGIYFAKYYDGLIPWAHVRDIQVHNGYNGKNVWIMLDASLVLRGYSILDRVYNMGSQERLSFLRLQSHQYRFSAPQLLRDLREIAPPGVHSAYSLG